MSALEWQRRMPAAPKLTHDSSGLVYVVIDGATVLFPTEADARFFHAAYTDVPNLVSENGVLRGWIAEEALLKAQAQAQALTEQVAALTSERDALQKALATEAEAAARARGRAKILALAIKHKVTP